MAVRRFSPGQTFRRRLARWAEKTGAAGGWRARSALRLFEGLAGLPAVGPRFHALSGVMHAAAGRDELAIPHYEALRRGMYKDPDPRWVRYMLLHCLSRRGRAAEAIDSLIESAAAEPAGSRLSSFPFPWYLATPALATSARVEALNTVVARHPRAGEALIFLACLETLLGHYEQSTTRLRHAASLRWPDLHPPAATGLKDGRGHKPPAFLIIGQAKAGTTALYTCLCSHPRFEPPLLKEPRFWSEYFAAGADWYRAHFPPLPQGSEWITGEASATYFQHPEAPRRIAAAMPDVKLILLLREPVARAYSEYSMLARQGLEKRTWTAVVASELESIPTCPLDDEALDPIGNRHSYLLHSAALPHLKCWLAYFPPEQLLIVRTSELARDLPGSLRRVCVFLDLPYFEPVDGKRENEGRYPPMAPEIQQRLRAWFALHERVLEDFLANLSEKTL